MGPYRALRTRAALSPAAPQRRSAAAPQRRSAAAPQRRRSPAPHSTSITERGRRQRCTPLQRRERAGSHEGSVPLASGKEGRLLDGAAPRRGRLPRRSGLASQLARAPRVRIDGAQRRLWSMGRRGSRWHRRISGSEDVWRGARSGGLGARGGWRWEGELAPNRRNFAPEHRACNVGGRRGTRRRRHVQIAPRLFELIDAPLLLRRLGLQLDDPARGGSRGLHAAQATEERHDVVWIAAGALDRLQADSLPRRPGQLPHRKARVRDRTVQGSTGAGSGVRGGGCSGPSHVVAPTQREAQQSERLLHLVSSGRRRAPTGPALSIEGWARCRAVAWSR